MSRRQRTGRCESEPGHAVVDIVHSPTDTRQHRTPAIHPKHNGSTHKKESVLKPSRILSVCVLVSNQLKRRASRQTSVGAVIERALITTRGSVTSLAAASSPEVVSRQSSGSGPRDPAAPQAQLPPVQQRDSNIRSVSDLSSSLSLTARKGFGVCGTHTHAIRESRELKINRKVQIHSARARDSVIGTVVSTCNAVSRDLHQVLDAQPAALQVGVH